MRDTTVARLGWGAVLFGLASIRALAPGQAQSGAKIACSHGLVRRSLDQSAGHLENVGSHGAIDRMGTKMRAHLILALLLIAPAAKSQTIEIVAIEERSDRVEISILTDLATPFDVMAGISLVGQGPRDVFIGNDLRHTIWSQSQVLSVPTFRSGIALPSGVYNADVNFYPRWGASNSPESTKAISEDIEVRLTFSLSGSGVPSEVAVKRENLQLLIMLNTTIGDIFDLGIFEGQLGPSESTEFVMSAETMRAHYFPNADMTLFESPKLGTIVDWKVGR